MKTSELIQGYLGEARNTVENSTIFGEIRSFTQGPTQKGLKELIVNIVQVWDEADEGLKRNWFTYISSHGEKSKQKYSLQERYWSDNDIKIALESGLLLYVNKLTLTSRVSRDTVSRVFESELMGKMTHIYIDDVDLGVIQMNKLARNNLGELKTLSLVGCSIGDREAAVLAKANANKLTELTLLRNYIGDEGAQALSKSSLLGNLWLLDLAGNNIRDDGMIALSNSRWLRSLKALNIGGNYIGDLGASALATSENFKTLDSLNIAANWLSEDGEQALIDSPVLSNAVKSHLAF